MVAKKKKGKFKGVMMVNLAKEVLDTLATSLTCVYLSEGSDTKFRF